MKHLSPWFTCNECKRTLLLEGLPKLTKVMARFKKHFCNNNCKNTYVTKYGKIEKFYVSVNWPTGEQIANQTPGKIPV